MAFMTLNGITVPTAEGGVDTTFTEVGDRTRALSGLGRMARRGVKRKWTVKTTVQTVTRAVALTNRITGQGHGFPYNGSRYPADGLAPSTFTAATFVASQAADGAPVYDENGVLYAKYGGSALFPALSYSNAMSTDRAALAASTADWTAGTNTFAVNKDHCFTTGGVVTKANGCLQVATISGASTSQILNAKIPAGTQFNTYEFSAFVKTLSGFPPVFTLDDANNVSLTATSPAPTVDATNWRRVRVVLKLTLASPSLRLRVSTSGGAGTFVMDGLQMIETSGSEAITRPFALPSVGAVSATNVVYADSCVGIRGMTVNFWTPGPTIGTPSVQYVYFAAGPSGSPASNGPNQIVIAADQPSGSIYLQTTNAGGTVDKSANTAMGNTAWHMVTAVIRLQPDTGEFARELWIDGTRVLADNSAVLPTYTSVAQFSVGSYFGLNNRGMTARISDLQVLPYPVDATAVAGWYASLISQATAPKLILAGDIVDGQPTQVVGRIDNANYTGVAVGGTWRPDARMLAFTLEEV